MKIVNIFIFIAMTPVYGHKKAFLFTLSFLDGMVYGCSKSQRQMHLLIAIFEMLWQNNVHVGMQFIGPSKYLFSGLSKAKIE